MKHSKGDLLDLLEAGTINVIAHQVNTKGVMGAGIAKQIADRYPEVLKEYKTLCSNTENLLGSVQILSNNDDKTILNVFSQLDYDADKRQTNYVAIATAFASYLEAYKTPIIGIPKYFGCGLGGGNWDVVEEIFKDLEQIYDVEFIVVEWDKDKQKTNYLEADNEILCKR